VLSSSLLPQYGAALWGIFFLPGKDVFDFSQAWSFNIMADKKSLVEIHESAQPLAALTILV